MPLVTTLIEWPKPKQGGFKLKRLMVIGIVILSMSACTPGDIDLFEKVTGISIPDQGRQALADEVGRRVEAGEDRRAVEQSIAIEALAEILPRSTKKLSPSEAREHGKKIATRRGWGAQEFACIDKLWGTHESGWRWNADNPSSSAYGIPQALPGSKMGPGWQDDVDVQINWGYNYVTTRYGGPCQALKFWNSRGWY